MAQLVSAKMEAFAQGLAKGLTQAKAYVAAGYANHPSAASRMAQRDEIQNRVKEIQSDKKVILRKYGAKEDGDRAETMAELGIDRVWVADAYRDVYEESMRNGNYAAANTAIAHLHKMMEDETEDHAVVAERGDRIKVSDALDMLRAMKGVAESAVTRDPPMRIIDPDREALPFPDDEDVP